MHPSTTPLPSLSLEDGFDYLSEPNENLICPICRNPFVDPVMCESTDHVFCRICLIKSLELSSTCPIDRLPLSLSLVAPAPKVLIKLVDELLVSCPFKSQLDCAFVCQRDLMGAHVRSHQSQHFSPSSISQQQVLGTSSQPRPLDQHHKFRPSSPLRFQFISGRATFAEDHSSLTQTPGEPQKLSDSSDSLTTATSCSASINTEHSGDAAPLLEHCPFEQFGCTFIGTPETIKHKHFSPPDPFITPPDQAHCPFSSVQEILKSFQNLEKRNTELKQQLSQSLVKQDKLASVIQNLNASFRQLWLSQQPSMTNPPFTDSSVHTSPLVKSHHPAPICTAIGDSVSSIPDSCSSARRSSDGSLPIYGSRLNYDTSNGSRLKHANHYPPPHVCQSRHFSSPLGFSTSLMFRKNIRASTFVRKGEVVTPTTRIHPTVSPLNPSTSFIGSDEPTPDPSRTNNDPSWQSESCMKSQLGVNSCSANPQVIQMIETIKKYLSNIEPKTQQHENFTTSAGIHTKKILDDLKEVKNLLGDLIDRGIGESKPSQLPHRQQRMPEEITSDTLSSSHCSTNSSSVKLSCSLSLSDRSSSSKTTMMDHMNVRPIDRRNSSHLKL